METSLRAFENLVPKPKFVARAGGRVYRYIEETIHQALIQKLARVISGLRAAQLLMEAGFVQEQASLQRVLDELHEDILFLSAALIYDDITPDHLNYLKWFYEEEFDANSAIESSQRRGMVGRKKIRAYLAKIEGNALGVSEGVEVYRTVSKAYSGYIHAASPHIMDMYAGDPPCFQVRGMLGTPRHIEHSTDLWNYYYRGIISFAFSAKAFGQQELFDLIYKYMSAFAEDAGRDYSVIPG